MVSLNLRWKTYLIWRLNEALRSVFRFKISSIVVKASLATPNWLLICLRESSIQASMEETSSYFKDSHSKSINLLRLKRAALNLKLLFMLLPGVTEVHQKLREVTLVVKVLKLFSPKNLDSSRCSNGRKVHLTNSQEMKLVMLLLPVVHYLASQLFQINSVIQFRAKLSILICLHNKSKNLWEQRKSLLKEKFQKTKFMMHS